MNPNDPQNPYQAPQQPPQPAPPQTPSSYAPPVQQSYDPNYLDSIAAPPAQGKFLSGTFGKLFWVLIGVFVLAVSLIIAFSGGDDTADLQQIAVRLDNFSKTAKTVQTNIHSKNLKNTNATFEVWLSGTQTEAEELLSLGGVKKTDYNKQMVTKESTLTTELDEQFENARLSAKLNRVYSATMATETDKILIMLDTMSKKSKSSKIRDFAKSASTTLTQIQKDFADFKDDGN